MKPVSLSLVGGVMVVGLWLFQEGAGLPATRGRPERPTATRPRPGQPLVPMHGLALQIHRAEGVVSRLAPAIREVAELGADTVTISFSGYQKHAGSWRINNDQERTPDPDDMVRLIAVARASRLRVILMPKILLSEPRGSEWRGRIQPPSWKDWFDQYRRFIVPWARLAEEARADVFVVGSELVSAEKHTPHWLRTIGDVRRVFRGQLAYSANWDHYSKIEFWNKVDLIGLTTYYKLSDTEMPALSDLLNAWVPIKKQILSWQRTAAKPLLLTEVGWPSQPGCSIEAWNYYRHTKPTPEGLEEQRRCYEAFVQTWADVPQLAGTIWWEWTPEPAGPQDFGYTPKAKPAEQVLRRWFASQISAAGGPQASGEERPGPADSP